MAIWWIDAVSTAFDMRVPALPSNLFRVGIAIAVLWKFISEHFSGAWHYLDDGTYVRYCYVDAHRRGPFRSVPLYKIAYVTKWVAAISLLLGTGSQLGALLLAVWFALEIGYDWKYHTIFLLLACAVLAVDSGAAAIVRVDSASCLLDADCRAVLIHGATSWVWPKWIILLIVVQMYWASAYTKIRSAPFRSGAALAKMSRFAYANRTLLRHWEFYYPKVVVRQLIEPPPEVCRRRWAVAAWGTIAGEALIPFGLASAWLPVYFSAVASGTIMHAGFAALLPRKITPFSIAFLAAYVMVIPS